MRGGRGGGGGETAGRRRFAEKPLKTRREKRNNNDTTNRALRATATLTRTKTDVIVAGNLPGNPERTGAVSTRVPGTCYYRVGSQSTRAFFFSLVFTPLPRRPRRLAAGVHGATII